MLKTLSNDKLVGTALGNYRLERFIGQSKIGPTYLAHSDTTTYLLRFLEVPTYASPRDHEIYLEHFQYRASQITALQHPYILPLFDFGIYRGLPYLISPHIPLRSLRSRIEKNGALNTFTVGRYLDQVATALEYTHEHGVLHGSLSVNNIFIRLDGQLVLADIGVRSLLDLNAHDTFRSQLLEWSEAYAPEQQLSKPTSPATDVYALGVVVYHLLTGSPAFEGKSPEEIARQHLFVSLPPLSRQRSDLPPGLDSILARALAKDPAQRYRQPGAFANAYHNAMGLANRTRLPFVVVSEVPSAQPYGTGTTTSDMQFSERTWSNNHHSSGSPSQPSVPHSLHGFSDDVPLNRTDERRQTLMHRFGRKQAQRTLLIAVLVALLVIASSAIGVTLLAQKGIATSSASGQVTFFADQSDPTGQTNALRISIQHLATPPDGYNYDAWMLNDQTEAVTGLGRLTQQGQTWSLTFSGTITNLLAIGDKLEITQEQGVVTAPAGQVILTGVFPVMAFQHIQHLLVSWPAAPGKVGFLVGLLQQTHLLYSQATVLQSISAGQNPVAIGCVTQSMLDIIEGAHGANYKPLAVTCVQQYGSMAGDGFGVLGKGGYIASAEEHAAFALSQKDATSAMHQYAPLMNIALTDITEWVTTIEQDLLPLQAHPADLSSIQEIATLADNAYHGVDRNGDGQIDPVAGEAGALTAYQQAQLMATLELTPSA